MSTENETSRDLKIDNLRHLPQSRINFYLAKVLGECIGNVIAIK